MHFRVAVILPEGIKSSFSEVEQILEPYNEEELSGPEKSWLSEKEIDNICDFSEISRDDLPAIVDNLQKHELGGGCDHRGIWRLCNWNPNGKWDYWREMETVTGCSEIAAFAFILPDGSWHERDDGGFSNDPASRLRWNISCQKALEANPNSEITFVDCHV